MKWRLHFGHTLEIWKMHEALGEQPPTSLPTASPKLLFPSKRLFILLLLIYLLFYSFAVLGVDQVGLVFVRLSFSSVLQHISKCGHLQDIFIWSAVDHICICVVDTCDALKTPILKYRKLQEEVFH